MQPHTELLRPTLPEGAEVISHIPINRLFVLVHPLNEPLGDVLLDTNHTRRVRKDFFEHALAHFTPHSANDVLVLIPNIGPRFHDLRTNVLKTKVMMEQFQTQYSWTSLADAFEHTTEFPRHVLLGENIPNPSIPATVLEKRLEKHGFGIMSDTTIVLGGELAPNCVMDAALDLLSLPQVGSVYIDLRVIVGIADYARKGLYTPEHTAITFAKRMFPFHKVQSEGKNLLKVSNH